MDAVVATSDGCAFTGSWNYTECLQESGDIFRDDDVVQHCPLVPILSEGVEVLEEVVLGFVVLTIPISAVSGTHV